MSQGFIKARATVGAGWRRGLFDEAVLPVCSQQHTRPTQELGAVHYCRHGACEVRLQSYGVEVRATNNAIIAANGGATTRASHNHIAAANSQTYKALEYAV